MFNKKYKKLKEENSLLWYYLYLVLTCIIKIYNEKSKNYEELYEVSDNVLSYLNFGETFGSQCLNDFRNRSKW
jgi:hypothetical protein